MIVEWLLWLVDIVGLIFRVLVVGLKRLFVVLLRLSYEVILLFLILDSVLFGLGRFFNRSICLLGRRVVVWSE